MRSIGDDDVCATGDDDDDGGQTDNVLFRLVTTTATITAVAISSTGLTCVLWSVIMVINGCGDCEADCDVGGDDAVGDDDDDETPSLFGILSFGGGG